jgi:hypothetical protein
MYPVPVSEGGHRFVGRPGDPLSSMGAAHAAVPDPTAPCPCRRPVGASGPQVRCPSSVNDTLAAAGVPEEKA